MSELTHYGVKGMRWGVRRKRPTTYAERRARTKRALKIAGAVAGGAALGYVGYRNRDAIARISRNPRRAALAGYSRTRRNVRSGAAAYADFGRTVGGMVKNDVKKAGKGFAESGRAFGKVAKGVGNDWREYGKFLNDRRKAGQQRKRAIEEVRKANAHHAATRQYDRKTREPALLKLSRRERHTNFVNAPSHGKNNTDFLRRKGVSASTRKPGLKRMR